MDRMKCMLKLQTQFLNLKFKYMVGIVGGGVRIPGQKHIMNLNIRVALHVPRTAVEECLRVVFLIIYSEKYPHHRLSITNLSHLIH